MNHTAFNEPNKYKTSDSNASAKYTSRKWGKEMTNSVHHELKWRTGAASFWAMVFMVLPFGIFVFLSTFKIVGVFASTSAAFARLLSFQSIGYLIALQILCLPNSYVLHKCSQAQPVPFNTNWNVILHIFHPRQLVWVVVTAILGFLHVAVLTSLISDVILAEYCTNDAACSYSRRASLLAFGTVQGFFHGVFFFARKDYVLHFPVIQERKFFRVRDSLPSCLKKALDGTVESIKIFYLLCAITDICLYFITILISVRGLSFSAISSTLSNLNFSFLWICAAVGLAISISMTITQQLCKIFLTQEYSFILKSDFIDGHCLLLQESLLSENQLLRHLAFLDLCHIGKFDSKRRKEIFEITIPGGHPENWNLVLGQCLLVIAESAKRFHWANAEEAKISQSKAHDMAYQQRNIAPSQDKSPELAHETPRRHVLFSPAKDWTSTEEVAADLPQESQTSYHRLKMCESMPSYMIFIYDGEMNAVEAFKAPRTASSRNSSILSTLFDERIEFKAEAMFQDYQIVIWTLEALSSLVSASYHEDTYGVVQRTLPQILVALMSFLEAIELYLKNSVKDERALMHKITEFQKRKDSSNNAQSYKLAVQTSIYKISSQFGPNLESVRIPREYRKRLDAFVEFRD